METKFSNTRHKKKSQQSHHYSCYTLTTHPSSFFIIIHLYYCCFSLLALFLAASKQKPLILCTYNIISTHLATQKYLTRSSTLSHETERETEFRCSVESDVHFKFHCNSSKCEFVCDVISYHLCGITQKTRANGGTFVFFADVVSIESTI